MTEVRVCVVGGGSYNWTPTLFRDLAATPELSGTMVLHDLNADAAAEMARLGEMIVAATGAPWQVTVESDRTAALRDADFVVLTITTGGLEAMRADIEIPQRYGIVQSVGDTVGPGGLARGLRNIPVVVEIARTMERVCPNAWLLNLTNPMTTITRAVAKTTSIKVIGLCHELFGTRRMLTRLFDATLDEVELRVAGINHLIWLIDARIRGEDALAMLRDYLDRGGTFPQPPPAADHDMPFQDRWQVKPALFATYGYLPAAGDRHLAEFFSHFLSEDAEHGAAYGVLPTTIEQRQAKQRDARNRVRRWLDGSESLPTARSEEEMADVIAAIATGKQRRIIANLPNRGQIDDLPRDVVVETMAMVGATGAHGIVAGPLPPGVRSTLLPHIANQEMIVDAALSGDRQLALQALLGDPLVRDKQTAPRLLEELLAANAAYLSLFQPRA